MPKNIVDGGPRTLVTQIYHALSVRVCVCVCALYKGRAWPRRTRVCARLSLVSLGSLSLSSLGHLRGTSAFVSSSFVFSRTHSLLVQRHVFNINRFLKSKLLRIPSTNSVPSWTLHHIISDYFMLFYYWNISFCMNFKIIRKYQDNTNIN